MKVLLINPASELIQASYRIRSFVLPILPSGLAYIASVLRNDGIEVSIIDQHATKESVQRIVDRISKEKPDAVGFSVLTPVVPMVSKIVSGIRRTCPDTLVFWGNIHANVFPDTILREDLADVIVFGEGEMTSLQLIHCLAEDGDLSKVDGIAFKRDGEVKFTKPRQPIIDLDSLPYPSWDLLDFEYYSQGIPLLSVRDLIIPIVGSRGCPWKCTFCSQDQVYEKPRFRSIAAIVDEIEYMHERYQAPYVGFNDANFPFSIRHGLKFCEELVKRGLHKKIRWVTETRVDLLNEELVMAMKRSGCHLIMIGFEVGNQHILDSINKKTTLAQARRIMGYIKKAGILTLGLWMLGLPGETTETCMDTIRFAKELDCDIVKFNVAVPLPGSRFYEQERGRIATLEPEKFTSWTDWSAFGGELAYAPEGMSHHELALLQRKAMNSYYLRPGMILRHIRQGTITPRNMVLGGIILIGNALRSTWESIFSGNGNKPQAASIASQGYFEKDNRPVEQRCPK